MTSNGLNSVDSLGSPVGDYGAALRCRSPVRRGGGAGTPRSARPPARQAAIQSSRPTRGHRTARGPRWGTTGDNPVVKVAAEAAGLELGIG